MKHLFQFLLRLGSALLIAGFVAFVQYALWDLANSNQPIADAEQEVKGFAYSGYQRHQSPLTADYPSLDELTGDVDLLAQYTNRLRTYSSLDNAAVVPLAGFRGLKVTHGIWLDRDEEKNAREVAAGIQIARQYKHVERLIVGNESLLRQDMKPDTLIPLLEQVRKATRKPVSTAEPWHVWLKYPELAKHVDFITVHLLPYHEGLPVEKALDYAMQRYDELAKAFPRKKIVIGEIGWPSRGPVIEAAVASRANEALFIRSFLASERTLKLDYYIMEAIDQPWKMELEGWAGAYWGVFNADREPKFSLEGAVPRDIRWQSKAYNASLYAFAPMLLIGLLLGSWSFMGRLWLAILVQACVTTLVLGINVPADYYLSQRDLVGLSLLIAATLITIPCCWPMATNSGRCCSRTSGSAASRPCRPCRRNRNPSSPSTWPATTNRRRW